MESNTLDRGASGYASQKEDEIGNKFPDDAGSSSIIIVDVGVSESSTPHTEPVQDILRGRARILSTLENNSHLAGIRKVLAAKLISSAILTL